MPEDSSHIRRTDDQVLAAAATERNSRPGRNDDSMAVRHYEVDQFERTVLAARASVRLLRDYAETALLKWELAPRIDDVTLVVSELATNAVRAQPGHKAGQMTLRLSVRHGGGVILVELTD